MMPKALLLILIGSFVLTEVRADDAPTVTTPAENAEFDAKPEDRQPKEPPKKAEKPKTLRFLPYDPAAGSVVRLLLRGHRGELLNVPVARDYFAWQEFAKYLHASDDDGIAQMRRQGRVKWLVSGTQVRVIKVYDYFKVTEELSFSEIRILDGKFEGQTGFTMSVLTRGTTR